MTSLRSPLDKKILTNYQVHERMKIRFGPARDYECVSCGRPAYEWAYQHTAKEELTDPRKGSPYSEFSEDYAAMCRSCHRTLDRESYQENGRRNGLVAGAKLAARIQVDPEYREQVTQRLGAHLDRMKNDPEYSAQYKAHMRRTNLRRFRCDDCGYENNAGNLGHHRKATGHENRTEVI